MLPMDLSLIQISSSFQDLPTSVALEIWMSHVADVFDAFPVYGHPADTVK